MDLLDRAAILAAEDLVVEDVEVPEWGGTVRVRTMSGTARDKFEASFNTVVIEKNGKRKANPKLNMDDIRARLAAMTIVDSAGNLLFKDEDIKVLGAKSARALDRVFAVSQKLNGLSDDDVEDLAKN